MAAKRVGQGMNTAHTNAKRNKLASGLAKLEIAEDKVRLKQDIKMLTADMQNNPVLVKRCKQVSEVPN